jgi:hypothetical protein
LLQTHSRPRHYRKTFPRFGEKNLQEEHFNLWILLVYLRTIRVKCLTEQNLITDYLYVEYKGVREQFINLFLPNDPMIEREDESNITRRNGTEDERNFVNQIILKLKHLMSLATLNLQLKIDHDEEKQAIASLITAMYKKAETIKATEVTALALQDMSTNGQNNLEQHLKNLIQQVVRDQLTKINHQKQEQITEALPPSTFKPNLKKRKRQSRRKEDRSKRRKKGQQEQ